MSDLQPRKDLLDIESLSLEEIEYVLNNAVPFKQLFQRSVKKVPTLRGKTVLNLFYEAFYANELVLRSCREPTLC